MSDLKPSTGSDQSTPDPSTVRISRTAAATAGRMRASEKRMAERMAGRGWLSVPPEHPHFELIRRLLADTK